MSFLSRKIQNIYKDNHFNLYRRFSLNLIKGEGVTVFDDEGKEYIDALAGIAVNSVGHCHPNVVRAIQEQASQLMHISNLYYNAPQSSLSHLLTQISGMDKVLFCNSGLEANEAALKIARKYGASRKKQGNIISFEKCFHGRSIGTIAMGQEQYQEGFHPMPAGFMQLPYNDLTALDTIPGETIAIFVECIQGEGGIRVASADFMQKLANICQKHDILLIIDEIQTGVGRTGSMFAFEQYDIKPDIITLAKGLGGGMPIGAVLAREEIANILQPGNHGTTFGGNPLACAAALATIKTILEEDLIAKAKENGEYIKANLNVLASETDEIIEVRGTGLMIGIEFTFPCRDLAAKMLELGVLVSCTANNVIRIVPPLIIEKPELDKVVEVLAEALSIILEKQSTEGAI
jgi:acetylornithine/N-succinyldiaminopimelate aminotransferase